VVLVFHSDTMLLRVPSIMSDSNEKAAKVNPTGHTSDSKQSASDAQRETLDAIKKGERIALFIAGIVAFGTIGQWVTTSCNNASTSAQTEKLIKASHDFAASAESINGGIDHAVSKLNLQADALNNSVQQSSRLADDTEKANQNVVEADRPWMGGNITVTNFSIGKKPTVIVNFINSGRRPARLDLTEVQTLARETFPKNPDAEYTSDTTPSTSVVVPGQSTFLGPTLGEVIQSDLDLLDGGKFTYFIFAKVEYRDLRTNQRHWTHICVRYIPKLKSDANNGFRNCEEYNDAR
jgi:hypothetical protein